MQHLVVKFICRMFATNKINLYDNTTPYGLRYIR